MTKKTILGTLTVLAFLGAGMAAANCAEDETSASAADKIQTTAAKSLPAKVDKGANFKVAKMVCTSCQEKITKALTKNKTVKDVAFDMKSKTVTVTVKEPTETSILMDSFKSIEFDAEYLGTI